MCYCQSNVLYKTSIILFAALCDLNSIMHSFKNTLSVAHYKWVEPISVLTFAILFLHWHSVFSLLFSLAQQMVEKMLQQTRYHGEVNSGIPSCHCQAAAPAMVLWPSQCKSSYPCSVWHLCRRDHLWCPQTPGLWQPICLSLSWPPP